jgi:hypothetical protein
MPGERRGGRTRITPNRRTVLANRILAVLAGSSTASPKQRLSMLVNDGGLPADIRMAVAQRAFSGRKGGGRPTGAAKSRIPTMGRRDWRGRPESSTGEPRAITAHAVVFSSIETISGAELDTLFDIVADASAPAKAGRKAAAKLATYFLPKRPVNKRWRFAADECGFAINAEIAREYRDLDFELRALERLPTRAFAEIAQTIRRLQGRIDAIRRRLTCPCPTLYNSKQIWTDNIRLVILARKREDGIAPTAAEDAEEAHRKARFDCYVWGPEQTARRYRQDLEECFRKSRFIVDGAAPMSRKQRNDIRLLRWLYPPNDRNGRYNPEAKAEADAMQSRGHPFYHEKPAADGNFYPRDSKLRPVPDGEIIEEYDAHTPRYCIAVSGKPLVFTDELPSDFASDKAEPGSEATL